MNKHWVKRLGYLALVAVGLGGGVVNAPQLLTGKINQAPVTTVAAASSNYQRGIAKGVQYIAHHTGKSTLDSWDAVAISRSAHGLTKAQKAFFYRNIYHQFKELDGHYAATDYEKAVIGLAAIGRNPEKFAGHNLVADVIKTAPLAKSGINGRIFGVIALSTKSYGKKSTATVQRLVKLLLKAQNAAGGWSFGSKTSDLDMTGMALEALAMHPSYAGVKPAINRAVAMLKKSAFIKKTGGFFIRSPFVKTENANSLAMIVSGLSASGINVETTFKGTSGRTPITRLLQFQKASGQFRWLLNSNRGALNMATQQAVYALEQYQAFKLHRGSIFAFNH